MALRCEAGKTPDCVIINPVGTITRNLASPPVAYAPLWVNRLHMDVRLLLELPEDLAHVAMVRRVAREVLSSYRASKENLDDVETLVGELVTNAVRHSQASHYRVFLDLTDGRAIITVVDNGVGFTREEAPPPGTSRIDAGGEERIGGWGLPLIEMLADKVEFLPNEPHGTIVRAEKALDLG